jgi:hypothetical protein
LIKVLGVLLAQRIVLTLQPAAAGCGINQRLLSVGFFALSFQGGFVSLLLGFGFHPLLASFEALFIERIDIVRNRIAFGDIVLTQVEILVNDFAVVGLVEQLAFTARAGSVGVSDLPILGALVDVLRASRSRSAQQQNEDAQKAIFPGQNFHSHVHCAPTPRNENVEMENTALRLLLNHPIAFPGDATMTGSCSCCSGFEHAEVRFRRLYLLGFRWPFISAK